MLGADVGWAVAFLCEPVGVGAAVVFPPGAKVGACVSLESGSAVGAAVSFPLTMVGDEVGVDVSVDKESDRE
jgi:hypothetical protein